MLTQQKPLKRALRRINTSSSPSSSSASNSSAATSWIHLRSVLLVVASSQLTQLSSDRGSLKSPWSRRRRKHALLPKQWKSLFDSDGRLCDGGVKFLKKVRSGGVDPSIRAEVWPFLLGMYDLNSSKEERDSIRVEKRKEYDNLRKQCRQLLKHSGKSLDLKETSGNNCCEDSGDCSQGLESPGLEEVVSPKGSISAEGAEDLGIPMCKEEEVSPRSSIATEGAEDPGNPRCNPPLQTSGVSEKGGESGITCEDASESESESSNSDDSEETENTQPFLAPEGTEEDNLDKHEKSSSSKSEGGSKSQNAEDFFTWQRIIRLDAVRANAEWVIYSPSQAAVLETEARRLADSVGLKDYDHLEPSRIFHAARLIAILEAYTLYDSEIGYCQGMSDLLSPIIAVMEEDCEAFWCFVGFMRKARHNFRLDEVGIRRQLNIVSKIIKGKDSHLYNHLEKLQAEDCFFVYRMVVVLFRRELNFEQTLCLWEVMWADQAAIRAGIAKSAWGRMRLRAPPTDDLLLYAIAACVLQRRKLIVENYSSMDEIMRECNSMAGNLDVWKLLDDAHDLVVRLHDKI
ncbi:rab GTPase-activating protein 22 isoform X2 [Rhododendron vialii]|uniref:rab GTPase-activating protein 22 isoform X2 n=1 Tax=Rhododendron vialii TaxID=182163 RepID=UPI00265F6E79|nr:rab GTPase-activating protein 22 isoform X2 [Rhododendron vialii]